MAVTVVNMSGMTPAYAETMEPQARVEERAPAVPREDAKPEVREAPRAPENNAQQTKAVFAVDGDKNVVVRIIDSDGKVLRQIPPEEYMAAAARLMDLAKSLFDLEA